MPLIRTNYTYISVGRVVRSAATVSRSAAAGAGHMLPLILIFQGLSIAISVVGFAGLTSSMSTNVLERIREFGMMSAVGAPTAVVRRLVVLECIFVAAMRCLIASMVAAKEVHEIFYALQQTVGVSMQKAEGITLACRAD